MYIPEKKIIMKVEGEFKKRLPFLSHWQIKQEQKVGTVSPDLLITAKDNNKRTYRFCVELKSAGYPQHIRQGIRNLQEFTEANPSYYPVIVVPFISECGKRICDESKVGYMDLSGNTKIMSGGILIYTEGKERPKDTAPINQSIFSPKAARITKFFLNQPHAQWIQKDIVEMTGLSKGLVSRIVTKMFEAGYVTKKDGKVSLVGFDDLFSAWTESEMKRRERKKNYYVWTQNPSQLMEKLTVQFSRNKVKYAFTQEAGASLVAPFSTFDIVSVYIDSLDKFPEAVLSASKAVQGFNLTVIEAPDEYIFTKAQDKGGMKIVDNFQLYADLKKNPLRGEKQAEHILTLIKKGSK